MSNIKNCPFCGVGLLDEDRGFYCHPVNGCLMSGFPVKNDKDEIEKWNTRKPMEAIIKQLEFQAEQHNKRADEFLDKNIQISNHNRGRARSYEHALEVVKGLD